MHRGFPLEKLLYLAGGITPVVGGGDHSLLGLAPPELPLPTSHPFVVFVPVWVRLWPPTGTVGWPCRWVNANHSHHRHWQIDSAEVDIHESKAAHPSEHIAPRWRHCLRQFSLYLPQEAYCVHCIESSSRQTHPIMWHRTLVCITRPSLAWEPGISIWVFENDPIDLQIKDSWVILKTSPISM